MYLIIGGRGCFWRDFIKSIHGKNSDSFAVACRCQVEGSPGLSRMAFEIRKLTYADSLADESGRRDDFRILCSLFSAIPTGAADPAAARR